MRKVLWRGTGELEFVEDGADRPPVRKPDDVRIRVTAAGVCGTDVHIVQGRVRFVDPPLVLGHEFAGVVEECGPAVTRIRPGDRVKCDSVCGCGACAWCAAGATQFCASGSEFGITRDGGWADWVVAPERNLHALPDAIPDEVAAIMDVEVFGALRKPGICPGDTVAVFGPGPAGLIALQAARAMGAGTVILCGTRPERLQVGAELGASHAIDINRQNPVEFIRGITGGNGADLVFEAAGNRKSVLDSLEAVRPQGKVVLYGVHGSPVPDLPLDRIVLKDLLVYGALTNRTGWGELMAMVADGSINLARIITHAFPLEQTAAAYAASSDRSSGCLKAVLRIS
ncbi:MAG: alcohol dehydrogenase catalytic domain-containing protein [Acidobacteriota bacterium]